MHRCQQLSRPPMYICTYLLAWLGGNKTMVKGQREKTKGKKGPLCWVQKCRISTRRFDSSYMGIMSFGSGRCLGMLISHCNYLTRCVSKSIFFHIGLKQR